MARVHKRLCHTPIDATVETVYTSPANTKTIVRHIHVSNPGAAAATFTLSIGTDAAGTRIVDGKSVPPDDYIDIYGSFVLEAAEIMQAASGTDDQMVLTMNGEQETV